MAYSLNTYYYIAPVSQPSKYLNRLGNGAPANNQDVTLYSPLGSPDQRWKVELAGNGGMLLNALNDSHGLTGSNRFALNIWRGATKYNNCDIVKVANNTPKDYVVNLETHDGNQNIYRICIMGYGLYMTARSDGSVYWEAKKGTGTSSDQLWKLSTTQSSGGGDITTGILSKDTMPLTATASTPYIINGIPDKQQSDGIDDGVEYHPGCGFANGTNFNTSPDGAAVKSALQSYVKKVFGDSASLTDAQTCYYLYGERIKNGANQQFHPGVDISYSDGAAIRAIFGGTVVYAGGSYGTVSIKVPTQNNVVTNYVHMKNIPATIKSGAVITAGTVVGYQGAVGASQGSHLHFEVRQAGASGPAGSTNQPSSPMTTIKPYGYMKG